MEGNRTPSSGSGAQATSTCFSAPPLAEAGPGPHVCAPARHKQGGQGEGQAHGSSAHIPITHGHAELQGKPDHAAASHVAVLFLNRGRDAGAPVPISAIMGVMQGQERKIWHLWDPNFKETLRGQSRDAYAASLPWHRCLSPPCQAVHLMWATCPRVYPRHLNLLDLEGTFEMPPYPMRGEWSPPREGRL